MIWYTNAPESYDYSYVETIGTLKVGKTEWRKIKVTDDYRFENFQTPRYNSGLYVVKSTHDIIMDIRSLPEVTGWTRGQDYPDIPIPEGYGWSYNMLSGNLIIIDNESIGKPWLDPRYERYHCM